MSLRLKYSSIRIRAKGQCRRWYRLWPIKPPPAAHPLLPLILPPNRFLILPLLLKALLYSYIIPIDPNYALLFIYCCFVIMSKSYQAKGRVLLCFAKVLRKSKLSEPPARGRLFYKHAFITTKIKSYFIN